MLPFDFFVFFPWHFCEIIWNKKLPSNCYSVTLYSEKRGSQLNKNNSQNYRIHKKHSTAAPLRRKAMALNLFNCHFWWLGFYSDLSFSIYSKLYVLTKNYARFPVKQKTAFFIQEKNFSSKALHFRMNFHSYHKKILYSLESGKIEYSWVTLFN